MYKIHLSTWVCFTGITETCSDILFCDVLIRVLFWLGVWPSFNKLNCLLLHRPMYWRRKRKEPTVHEEWLEDHLTIFFFYSGVGLSLEKRWNECVSTAAHYVENDKIRCTSVVFMLYIRTRIFWTSLAQYNNWSLLSTENICKRSSIL